MCIPGEILRRLHMLLHRGRFQAELEQEMQLHIELRQQQQIAAGLSPDAARLTARRKFGNATHLKETSQMAWGWDWLKSFAQDIAYGTRALLRHPGITIVALASLALGIGANTAIFSLLDAVMLRSLPVKDPQQLAAHHHQPTHCCPAFSVLRAACGVSLPHRHLRSDVLRRQPADE